MNRIKKVSRPAASLLALLCVTLFASTVCPSRFRGQ